MNRNYHPLPSRLWVVQLSEALGKRLKSCVTQWPKAQQWHEGDQLIRSIDSIGVNISEGYARMHSKERLLFFSRAMGSLEEVIFWLRRCGERGLIHRFEVGTCISLVMKLNKGLLNLAAAENRNGCVIAADNHNIGKP